VVGYLGFENISLIEKVIKFKTESFDNSDSIFGIYNTILAFDHFKHQIILISNVKVEEYTALEEAYSEAKKKLKKLRDELKKPVEYCSDFSLDNNISGDFDSTEFCSQVESGKKNIAEGDIFQIVLSKRFSAKYKGDLLKELLIPHLICITWNSIII
jgi:anthranilate synthase component 1